VPTAPLIPVFLIASIALVAGLAVPARAQAAPCTKAGDTVLRVTGDVVLVRRGMSRYLTCWRPTGRRLQIGGFAGGRKPPRLIRSAGEWVAYIAEYCSEGKDDFPVVCEPVVELVRARDGRNDFFFVAADRVTDLVLCGDRRVIGLGVGPLETRRAFSFNKILAESPALDLHSLERRRGRAIWTQGAERGETACPGPTVRSTAPSATEGHR
jgi:hypothetical protein